MDLAARFVPGSLSWLSVGKTRAHSPHAVLIIFSRERPFINNPSIETFTTMIRQIAGLLAVASYASAIELTPDNYLSETDGKTVFLKYFAPW